MWFNVDEIVYIKCDRCQEYDDDVISYEDEREQRITLCFDCFKYEIKKRV